VPGEDLTVRSGAGIDLPEDRVDVEIEFDKAVKQSQSETSTLGALSGAGAVVQVGPTEDFAVRAIDATASDTSFSLVESAGILSILIVVVLGLIYWFK
jgi:hypothetical protein